MAQVLVIIPEDWIAEMLVEAVQQAGHNALRCDTAAAGFEMACAVVPDCIVCDVNLPDQTGAWLAEKLREQTTDAAVTPIMFMSSEDESDLSMSAFQTGADVLVTKPFRLEDVLAQVEALLRLAARLRQTRVALTSHPAPPRAAIEGSLEQAGVATLLAVFEMERKTGEFQAWHREARISLWLQSGRATGAREQGKDVPLLDAVDHMLDLPAEGQFRLTTVDSPVEPPGVKTGTSIRELLLAAAERRGSVSPGPRGLDEPDLDVAPVLALSQRTPLGAPSSRTGSGVRLPRPPKPPRSALGPLPARPITPLAAPRPVPGEPLEAVDDLARTEPMETELESVEEVEADLDSYRPPS